MVIPYKFPQEPCARHASTPELSPVVGRGSQCECIGQYLSFVLTGANLVDSRLTLWKSFFSGFFRCKYAV